MYVYIYIYILPFEPTISWFTAKSSNNEKKNGKNHRLTQLGFGLAVAKLHLLSHDRLVDGAVTSQKNERLFGPQNDALGKVDSLKIWPFWYQFARFLGCKLLELKENSSENRIIQDGHKWGVTRYAKNRYVRLTEKILHYLGCPKRSWYWYETSIWGILSRAGCFPSTVCQLQSFLFWLLNESLMKYAATYCGDKRSAVRMRYVLGPCCWPPNQHMVAPFPFKILQSCKTKTNTKSQKSRPN